MSNIYSSLKFYHFLWYYMGKWAGGHLLTLQHSCHNSRHSFRHQNNQDCRSRSFRLLSRMERLLLFIVHGNVRYSVFTWSQSQQLNVIALFFLSPFADSLIFKSVIKTIRLLRGFGLIGNHDYDRRKRTRLTTIEPHSDKILIVLMAKGTH